MQKLNLLIPTDFSENAYKAIEFVYKYFKLDKINIRLSHTIQPPKSTSGVLLRLDDLMKKDAELAMEDLLAKIQADFNHKPEFDIRYGYLKDWIETFARSYKIDLIVMGTKGESNIASRLVGSVTESIVRTSEVPLLAIPNLEYDKGIHHFVLALEHLKINNPAFIESLVDAIHMESPKMGALTVISDSHPGGLPKSIPLDGFQFGVETIESNSAVNGINEYLEQNRVDILGLYHSQNSRFDYLFNRSVTKNICGKTPVPLLIIPNHG
jgi:nucleotide-binding universal stress UspA family protein